VLAQCRRLARIELAAFGIFDGGLHLRALRVQALGAAVGDHGGAGQQGGGTEDKQGESFHAERIAGKGERR
jgi:hypothetical protein